MNLFIEQYKLFKVKLKIFKNLSLSPSLLVLLTNFGYNKQLN